MSGTSGHTRASITTRLRLPPNVSDADLFRIVSDALDVVEMVNAAMHEAVIFKEDVTDIGIGSPLANTAKAVFHREPGEHLELAPSDSEAQAYGLAFLEKLPQATRTITSAKFAGWVSGRARELLP